MKSVADIAGHWVSSDDLDWGYKMAIEPTGGIDTSSQIIAQIAWNIVFGGCLSIGAGWFGSRASRGGANARP